MEIGVVKVWLRGPVIKKESTLMPRILVETTIMATSEAGVALTVMVRSASLLPVSSYGQ